MKKLLAVSFYSLLCFCLTLGQPIMAQDKCDAKSLIQSTLDAVFIVLQKKDLSLEDKSATINEIVAPLFDFTLMAKLTLGKKYWPGLNNEEQKKFRDLFVKRLKESYRRKLMSYTDERVVYEPSVQEKNKIQIPTYLVSNNSDDRISIIYKLYHKENTWRIYDIEIQGVSIVQSYRSQFADILKNGTVNDLLTKLERPEPEDT